MLDANGTVRSKTDDALSGLIGIRHLTTFDLTTILEYYHNGTGFSAHDMRTYYRFIHSGYQLYQSTGTDGQLVFARNLTKGSYGRPSPMEDYLYLRLSPERAAGYPVFHPFS